MDQRCGRWFLCLCVAVCLSVITPSLRAETTGRVTGKVTDTTGAVVPDTKVTLVNEDTSVPRSSNSDKEGGYTFLQVPVGNYHLEFEHAGFKTSVQKGVAVQLNQVVNVNVQLEIGGTKEVVDVTSEAPLVDTSSTQLGAVVDSQSVANLPLTSRDTYQLLQLQPGVQGVGGADLFYGSGQAGAVSVNGGRGRANNFSVNGGDGNDLFVNGPGIQPSPDSIEEFRVLTNSFDAEYGRNSGAVINVVTKSGSNNVHGSGYEFLRNDKLNAKGYVDPWKPRNHQNVFGGTFGGPIKKDKTFFFTSYDGRRNTQGVTSDPVFVPTAAQRGGATVNGVQVADFSATPFTGVITNSVIPQMFANRGTCAADITAIGGAMPVVDPTNGVTANWSDVFPNSQMPVSCMDPVALDLTRQYVPMPNQPNLGPNVWQDVPNGHFRDDQFTMKVDHRLTNNQNLAAYYYFVDSYNVQPFTRFEALTPNLLSGFGNTGASRNQQVNLSHTWTITPTAVNEFRFTYFRESQGTFLHPTHTNAVNASCSSALQSICFTGTTDTPGVITGDPALGIQSNLPVSHTGVPFITLLGGFTIGNDYEGELPQTGNTFQWSDNFSKVWGKHTAKFGVDVRRMRFDQTLYFDPNGDYTFSGGGSNDLVALDATGAQNLFPNYLMGLPDSYLEGASQHEHIRSSGFYLFAQDSWKLKSNLTLNYGLRWELNAPQYDAENRVQTFRPGQADTVYPCVLDPATSSNAIALYGSTDCSPTGPAGALFPTGLLVPGDKGVPNGLTSTYYHSFAPRLGIAWSPGASGKTSVRAGWGLFYNPIEQLVMEQFQGEPPFGGSSLISEGLFNTPFLLQSCADSGAPCSTSNGAAPNPFFTVPGGIRNPQPGTPVDWSAFRPAILYGEMQPHIRSQYSAQYNLTIQREIANNMVFTIGYVGSQGHRLLATHDINFGNPQTCLDLNTLLGDGTCGPFYADSSFFVDPTTMVPAGFTFHLPYGSPGNITNSTGAAAPLSQFLPAGSNGISLVGLRPYSSPQCNPYTGTGCPLDGIPVLSSIFAQDTIANSAYNSLQVSFERRMSKGLQFLAAYTWSKSIDEASTFEEILNPLNPKADRALSLFDARHRFVFSYMWQLPVPKYSGAKEKVLNGWAISGITTFQSGFPIRIISNNDQELMNSFDFNLPGRPDQVAPFTTQNPKTNSLYYFDPTIGKIFGDPALGTLGTAPRSICCGPGINNWDMSIHKQTKIGERVGSEFRAEFFNVFNHTQFLNPDGNYSDGFYFGRIQHARDPRQIQFALKFFF